MPRHSNGKRQSPKKPEMERKRRQRINSCLSQIKRLIPEARELEIKKGCRLEKAEILEITVKFIQKVQNENTANKKETSVGHEECPVFFNTSNSPTRPIFQGHFDVTQHQAASPFYPAPSCCLDIPECECDTKQISPSILYRPMLLPTPRFFTPRCVSSNMLYDSARSGCGRSPFSTQQSSTLQSFKSENE